VRVALIYNPAAGKAQAGAVAAAVEKNLVRRGIQVELCATRHPKDAVSIARRLVAEVDVVVAIGGDGTVNEVVNGMAVPGARSVEGDTVPGQEPVRPGRPRARLAIVPAGTVNVLALELGLPFAVDRACEVIAAGRTTALDLGRVNGRGFVLMMGAGIDALTVRNVDARAKRRYRELAFVATGLRHGFAHRPPVFLVRAGGREYRSTFFVAGNSRYYAGRLGITPKADPSDGLLDLMLFSGTSRPSLAVLWLGIPGGLHLRNPDVTYLRSEAAELLPLEDEGVVWFQTDGELAGRLPAAVHVDRHALEVLVP